MNLACTPSRWSHSPKLLHVTHECSLHAFSPFVLDIGALDQIKHCSYCPLFLFALRLCWNTSKIQTKSGALSVGLNNKERGVVNVQLVTYVSVWRRILACMCWYGENHWLAMRDDGHVCTCVLGLPSLCVSNWAMPHVTAQRTFNVYTSLAFVFLMLCHCRQP